MRVLIVTSAFGDHRKGSRITDPSEIAAVLAGENSGHVIQSDHPDEQEAE